MPQAPTSSRLLVLLSLAALSATLTGCAMESTAPPEPLAAPTVAGLVHGGNQPVTYSTIQLYAAGTVGYASAATPLIASGSYYLGGTTGCIPSSSQTCYPNITTDTTGSFTIPASAYTCPTSNSQIYIVATGGNPGLTSGTNNTALSLMTALGNCSNLPSIGNVIINEVTTVAAVWSLQPFMTDFNHIGTSSTNSIGLSRAFTTADTITGISCGCAQQNPVSEFNSPRYAYPQENINSLANALAACINTTGGTTTGTPCNTLFTSATPSGGSAPTDTIGAALNIAHNPGSNVSTIYTPSIASSPFQPTLSAAPNDWTLSLLYIESPEFYAASGIDLSGNLWWLLCHTACYLSTVGPATTRSSITISPNGSDSGGGLAFDRTGNIWASTETSSQNYYLAAYNASGAVVYSQTSTGSVYPTVSIDSSNNAWINGSTGLTVRSSSGTTLVSGYTGTYGTVPDTSGGMWALGSSNTLFRSIISGSTIANTTYTGATVTSPLGLALDGSGSLWVLNGNSTFTKFTASGSSVTSPTPFSGGGLNTTSGGAFAIDGLGNAWVANTATSNLTEFSNAGTAISPSTGFGTWNSTNQAASLGLRPIYQPFSTSIDLSGNLWVLGNTYQEPGDYTFTLYLGMAGPVALALSPGTLP